MALIDSSTTEQLHRAILDDGFCYQADPIVGSRVNVIHATSFPFKEEAGLEFCKLSTFNDKVAECNSLNGHR